MSNIRKMRTLDHMMAMAVVLVAYNNERDKPVKAPAGTRV